MDDSKKNELDNKILTAARSILSAYNGDKEDDQYKKFKEFCAKLMKVLSDERKETLLESQNPQEVADLYKSLFSSHSGEKDMYDAPSFLDTDQTVTPKNITKPYIFLIKEIRPDIGDSVNDLIRNTEQSVYDIKKEEYDRDLEIRMKDYKEEIAKERKEEEEAKKRMDVNEVCQFNRHQNLYDSLKEAHKELSKEDQFKLGFILNEDKYLPHRVLEDFEGPTEPYRREMLDDLAKILSTEAMNDVLNTLKNEQHKFYEELAQECVDDLSERAYFKNLQDDVTSFLQGKGKEMAPFVPVKSSGKEENPFFDILYEHIGSPEIKPRSLLMEKAGISENNADKIDEIDTLGLRNKFGQEIKIEINKALDKKQKQAFKNNDLDINNKNNHNKPY